MAPRSAAPTGAPSEQVDVRFGVIHTTPGAGAESARRGLRPYDRQVQSGFRKDIQGLRALAVLLVALDHANVGPFTGGFIGVDVFFVISGFLITSLLIGEADRDRKVSLAGFYARRARRILPAATVVIVVTLAVSVRYLSGVQALAVAKDAVWATFFAANVHFSAIGTDYFSADVAPSPLQHYWSLAVEEQFYLVWPLLVMLLVWVARRRGWGVRRTLVPVLLVILVASLAYSIRLTQTDAVAAYFSTPARAWELGLGALIATAALRLRRQPPALLAVLSWVGLGAVAVGALAYDEHTLFPGIAVALPVVGTALLLGGGLGAARWGPQFLLGVRPMRVLGDWSYSFYLWHWPTLIIAAAVWRKPEGWSGAAVLGVALVLSALSYHLVENPVRRTRKLARKTWRGLVLYPTAVALTLPLAAFADHTVRDFAGERGAAITVAGATHSIRPLVRASVLAARAGHAIPAILQPDPLELDQAKADVGECSYFEHPDGQLCPRGDTEGSKTLLLIGDSHARQWIPALDQIAAASGYTAYYLVREGCPAADVTPWLSNGSGPALGCEAFQDWAREVAARLQPDLVLFGTHATENGFEGPNGEPVNSWEGQAELLQSGLVDEINQVRVNAGKVVVLGDPPGLTVDPAECLTARESTLASCMSDPDERSMLMSSHVHAAAIEADVSYVDPTPWFCWQGDCPLVVGDLIAMRDPGHVSSDYAAVLAPDLARALGLSAS
jgi:peptidoglycan/LPS O-acetylase OafA/YrhL